MADLVLPVKRKYFEQIQRGEEAEVYRLCNTYSLRLLHAMPHGHIERIVITPEHPKAVDDNRCLHFPYRGFVIKTITHPHFGSDPVQVYAIKLESDK